MAPPSLDRLPTVEGRKILRNEKYREGPAAGSRGEVWLGPETGYPNYIAYWGPPYGEHFLLESFEDALANR